MDKNNYNPEHNLTAAVNLLASILQKGVEFTRHIDTQSNILISICLAILIFTVTRFQSGDKTFLILSIFSTLATLTAFFAIHPPRFMRKRGQNESLLYNKRIAKFPSAKEYRRELAQVVGNQDAIIREYATEIYNIYKYFYVPKRKLFKISRNLLFIGIILNSVVFVINFYR